MKTIDSLLKKHSDIDLSFTEDFNAIISSQCDGYDGTPKDKLKSFFKDIQHGGCQSGMIGSFIYNSDNKEFYIKHLDDLEQYKLDLEDSLGESISNKDSLPHYTFMVWLCFEEYCYNLYRNIFED